MGFNTHTGTDTRARAQRGRLLTVLLLPAPPNCNEFIVSCMPLPAAQRELGDAYVKSEFRSHRDADAKFLAAFESQWREYLGVLRSQSVDAPGRDLTADELSAMSDEQKVQVVDIYEKSRKAGDEKPDL